MHQDEHNQPEQPETVAVPLSSDETEVVASPETAVISADPVLTSAAATPDASFAQTPIEPVASDPALGESLYSQPAWMTQGEPTSPETPAEADAPLLPPPISPEPALYVSPSWTASEAERVDAPSDQSDGSDLATETEHTPWQPTDSGEVKEAYAGDVPPPVWVTSPMSDAPAEENAAAEPRPYERPIEPHVSMPQGGPNWMLAFVCGWAAFTSFMEAPVAYAAKETMINGSTVTLTANDRLYGGLGFGLLGLGLLLFGIEALLWGRRRRGVSGLLTIGFPVLVSLAGVVFLILSHYPGSRI